MHRFSVLLLILLLGFSSCKKDKQEALFEINYTVDVNIQPGWNTFENHFLEVDGLSTRVQQQLDSRGISYDDISRVETAYTELYAIFGDTNLDLLDEVTVEIFKSGQPDSKVEAAYLDPVPDNARSRIQLIPSLANFKQHFSNEAFGLIIGMRPRESIPNTVECRLELKMAFIE